MEAMTNPTSESAKQAYDKIDRFLRNNLDDTDYADFSAALELVYADATPIAQTADARDAELLALKMADRLCKEALPKFNWGASALDANAIKLLNEVPGLISAAIAAIQREEAAREEAAAVAAALAAWAREHGYALVHAEPSQEMVEDHVDHHWREMVAMMQVGGPFAARKRSAT